MAAHQAPVPGILQARTLKWVAISFSSAWKWKVKVKSFSGVHLFTTPWTAAYQAPPSMGFSRQEYWSGVPLPSPRTTNIMLNYCVDGGYLILFWFQMKSFQYFTIKYMLWTILFVNGLYHIKEFFFYFSSLQKKLFYHDQCRIFSKPLLFCVYWDTCIIFLL